jgi:hypothetical protein
MMRPVARILAAADDGTDIDFFSAAQAQHDLNMAVKDERPLRANKH